ncbi:MAG TPA: ankyrin repeat domain-containing protein [Bryobacteraceae bacterium]|nr:ankyrin repeat domain-containing protein [Bryobacteraceae bacterium]
MATSLVAASADVRLVEAVKKSDKAAIRTLIPQHVDLSATDTDGSTALHYAVREDDVETANLLIGSGANVKSANRYGVTPLSLACLNGNAAMIEALLKAGADPNTALPGGETALMTAARTGKVDAVKALVAHGADVNVKEPKRGQTALMWAAADGNTAVVEELVEHGADMHAKTKANFTPLLFAIREGRIDTVRALLKAGADVNETWQAPRASGVAGISAMSLAVANAHYELASAMLDLGANPNAAAQGWTALHQITWVRKPGRGDNDPAPEGSGNLSSLDLVKKLVEHGANVNARMTRQGNVGRTSLNMIGATPFLMAARTADVPMMRLLVQLGADPLMPNADGSTPLLAAAGLGTYSPGEDPGTESEVLEAVKLTLELGGDINGVDKNGETVIHAATYKQVPGVAQYLIDKGAKIEIWNQKNKTGWTPLRIADGVIYGGGNFRISPPMAEVLRKNMSAAGVSTVVEPDIVRAGHPVN